MGMLVIFAVFLMVLGILLPRLLRIPPVYPLRWDDGSSADGGASTPAPAPQRRRLVKAKKVAGVAAPMHEAKKAGPAESRPASSAAAGTSVYEQRWNARKRKGV